MVYQSIRYDKLLQRSNFIRYRRGCRFRGNMEGSKIGCFERCSGLALISATATRTGRCGWLFMTLEAVLEAGEVVPRKSAGNRPALKQPSKGRSKVTNGDGVLLPDLDGRSRLARRYRDIARAILGDQGGADQCSESRQQLVRRFAAAAVLAERLESRLANGEEISIQEHAILSSTLVRLAGRIGIDRRMKHIVPSLDEYLASTNNTEEPVA